MSTIHLSPGNSKLGSVYNVSLRPIADCGNCDLCKRDCYALKAWRMYEKARAAWTRNAEAFRADPQKACEDIDTQLQSLDARGRLPKLFRIHTAGDFLSQEHVDAYIWLAKRWPQMRFFAFTKMHHLNYRRCPDNFAVLMSMWPGMPKPKRNRGRPKAWMQDGTETRIPPTAIACPGKCDTCGACWSTRVDVYFKKH